MLFHCVYSRCIAGILQVIEAQGSNNLQFSTQFQCVFRDEVHQIRNNLVKLFFSPVSWSRSVMPWHLSGNLQLFWHHYFHILSFVGSVRFSVTSGKPPPSIRHSSYCPTLFTIDSSRLLSKIQLASVETQHPQRQEKQDSRRTQRKYISGGKFIF